MKNKRTEIELKLRKPFQIKTTQLYCVSMKFDDWIQAVIELDLSFVGEFSMAIANFLAKIDETLFNIFGKCNQKIANAKINDQK